MSDRCLQIKIDLIRHPDGAIAPVAHGNPLAISTHEVKIPVGLVSTDGPDGFPYVHFNLKARLVAAGLSMREVARQTAIPVQVLSDWARGRHPKSLAELGRLAWFFEITLDELIYGRCE